MNFAPRTFKFLALLHSLGILVLVPTARTIQAFLTNSLEPYPGLAPYLVIGIIGLLIPGAIFYYRALYQRHPLRTVTALQAMLAAVLGLFALAYKLPIELFHLASFGLLACWFRLWLTAPSQASHGYWPFSQNFNPKPFISALFYSTLVSLADEILQWLTPERYCDWRDLWMNFLGTSLGLLLLEPFLTKKEI